MQKVIRGLLAASLAASAVMADVSNHTFIASRPAISNNCAMGMVAPSHGGKKGDMGADLSVTGMYRMSHNKAKLAKHFGGGQAADSNQNGKIEVAPNGSATNALTGDQIDYVDAEATAMSATTSLSPRRIEAGAQVTWNQSLGKWVNGLSFRVDVPVTYVRTEMRPTFTDSVANTVAGEGKEVSDFFAGTDLGKDAAAVVGQAALAKGQMGAKTSKTGVADVQVAVAYDFVREKDYTVGMCIHAGIPTGNKTDGVVAFEPTYGTRQFGLGAGLHGQFNLWRSEDGKNALDLNLCGKYTYKFSADEIRTAGMYDVAAGNLVAAGHYAVVAKKATTAVLPFANASTLKMSVEPKSRIDAMAGFCYRMNRVTIDMMYNLFYAQEEKVTLKDAWNEDLYGRPTAGVALGDVAFGDLTGGSVTGGAILKPANATGSYYVAPAAATTPAQVVHKVAGGFGYNFDTKTPIRVGTGAEVEFSSNNHSVNSWAVFAKLGINF